MSERRLAFVALASSGTCSVAEACRRHGISRKTGYKWLGRAAAEPATPLADRSRRPHQSPGRTGDGVEAEVLAVRDQFGWGARKIRAYLLARERSCPAARTVTTILKRHGRLGAKPATTAAEAPQRFERPEPNQLWQCDFKGPVELAGRVSRSLFTLQDDHSRYLLALDVVPDKMMATAWTVLWRLFGEVGLPEALLCDNGFAALGPGGRTGLSWFEGQLIRLGIRPCHGRPYHPQTQGKVERLHGTLEREVLPRCRRDTPEVFAADLSQWRTAVYNAVRPHEALGDEVPASRWLPSPRPRPAVLPEVEYGSAAVLRKVMQKGEVSWRNCEILVGAGIAGQRVRVEEADEEVAFFFGTHEIRRVRVDQLRKRAIM